jgi:hypothetical protein
MSLAELELSPFWEADVSPWLGEIIDLVSAD